MIPNFILILLFILASCAHGPNEASLSDPKAKKDYMESIEINMPYGEFKERYNEDNRLIESTAIFDVRLSSLKNSSLLEGLKPQLKSKITERVHEYLESRGLKVSVSSQADVKDDLNELILDDEYLDKLAKKYKVDSFLVLSSEINFDQYDKKKLLVTTDTKNYFFIPHFLFVETGGKAGWVDVNDVAIAQGESFEFIVSETKLLEKLEAQIFLQFKLAIDKLISKQGIIKKI